MGPAWPDRGGTFFPAGRARWLVALWPRNPVGWSFLATGLGFMIGLFAEQYAAYGCLSVRGRCRVLRWPCG